MARFSGSQDPQTRSYQCVLVYTVWYIQFGIQFDIYSLVYTIEFSNDFLHIKAIMLKCGQTEGQTD